METGLVFTLLRVSGPLGKRTGVFHSPAGLCHPSIQQGVSMCLVCTKRGGLWVASVPVLIEEGSVK